jgi:hypothetical protein
VRKALIKRSGGYTGQSMLAHNSIKLSTFYDVMYELFAELPVRVFQLHLDMTQTKKRRPIHIIDVVNFDLWMV